jgi:hypothetical protein
MSVPKLPLLVDLQQKVHELVLSITSCPTIIIFEKNALNYCKGIPHLALLIGSRKTAQSETALSYKER